MSVTDYFKAGTGKWWIGIGFLLFISTASYNIGWVALDDYETSIAPILPAQSRTFAGSNLLHRDAIRSPLAGFTLLTFSKMAHGLGIVHPISQFRFVLTIWSVFSFGMLTFFGRSLFRTQGSRNVYSFLIGSYFLSPLFLTRPMIEALSAPFLLAGAYFACDYANSERIRSLLLAGVLITVSALYRFQTGVCILVLVLLPLQKRKWRDLISVSLTLLTLFVASGLVDWLLKGSFHHTLRSYIIFNVNYHASYGITPFYTFPVMLTLLSIPPVFFSTYKGLQWKKCFVPLWPALGMLFLFVLAHSIISHKEERFMIPILPLYLAALVPLMQYLVATSVWRFWMYVAIDIPLLFLANFSIVQNNVVALSQYFDRNPNISKALFVEDSVVLFPEVFVSRPFQYVCLSVDEWRKPAPKDCTQAYAIRRDFRDRLGVPEDRILVGEFGPGPLESLVVTLNRKRNNRRDSIFVYVPKGCPINKSNKD